MIKKLFLLIAVISFAAGVHAQHAPGSWQVLPMSSIDFECVKATPEKVYYVTGGALYAFDREHNETEYFTPGSRLSDSGVSVLKYNSDEKYMMCVYDNCNIDLIYDSGKIVNLPEIKDANLTSAKAVNHIYFGKGRIYIATSFGIVVYDDQKHHVIESGIYNSPVSFIAEMGDYVVIAAKNLSDDNPALVYLGISPKAERHNTLSKFRPLRDVGLSDWLVVSDNSYVALLNNKLWKVTFNADYSSVQISDTSLDVTGATVFENCKDGYCLDGSSDLIIIDKEGNLVSRTSIPADLRNQKLSFWTSPASLWAADPDGIGNYDITASTPAVLSEKYFPQSSKQFNNCFVAYTPSGDEVYFNGVGQSEFHPAGNKNGGYDVPILLESYNWMTGEFTPRYPTNVTEKYSAYQQLGLLYGGPGPMVIDREDPSFVYTANNFDGLIVLKDGEVYHRYYSGNSPIHSGWGDRLYDVTLDRQGNLWVGMWHNNTGPVGASNGSPYKMLPKSSLDLLKKNPGSIEEKDADGNYKYWMQPSWSLDDVGRPDMRFQFSSFTDKGLRIGNFFLSWTGYDTKGTSQVSDDTYNIFRSVVDQDGNTLSHFGQVVTEDKKGCFWVGTSNGILIVDDMEQLGKPGNSVLNVRRPKVARNDGTVYADYLLDSENIISIAVDSNNKKWIGTANSGLFYVSEDGSEILAEYRTDNSPLLSNTITMLACDPHGNDVLIGTPAGLLVYSSDSAPAADDYSEVYAYPNPVRPDYTGWITIAGLMDKSLIKIADQQGNVIWSGKSEGGMAQWDGCDAAGNRVRSGVYMVMASQNATGNSSGAVCKIVVIN